MLARPRPTMVRAGALRSRPSEARGWAGWAGGPSGGSLSGRPAGRRGCSAGRRPPSLRARLESPDPSECIGAGGGRQLAQQQRVAGRNVLERHAHAQLGAQRTVEVLWPLQLSDGYRRQHGPGKPRQGKAHQNTMATSRNSRAAPQSTGPECKIALACIFFPNASWPPPPTHLPARIVDGAASVTGERYQTGWPQPRRICHERPQRAPVTVQHCAEVDGVRRLLRRQVPLALGERQIVPARLQAEGAAAVSAQPCAPCRATR